MSRCPQRSLFGLIVSDETPRIHGFRPPGAEVTGINRPIRAHRTPGAGILQEVQFTERPKMGIVASVRTWLRGELKDWAEAQLAHHRLSGEGFFDPWPVRKKWGEHLSGTHDWSTPLWSVLMFQSWLERSSSHDTSSTEIFLLKFRPSQHNIHDLVVGRDFL